MYTFNLLKGGSRGSQLLSGFRQKEQRRELRDSIVSLLQTGSRSHHGHPVCGRRRPGPQATSPPASASSLSHRLWVSPGSPGTLALQAILTHCSRLLQWLGKLQGSERKIKDGDHRS